MNRFGLLVTFLLFGAVARSESLTFVDLPKNCFTENRYPCSLRSLRGALKFTKGSALFSLGDKGALRFLGEDQFQLFAGTVWVQKAKDLRLIINPELSMGMDGEFFLEKTADSTVLVRNTDGEAHFFSDYLFKQESLPRGFQN